MDAQLIVLFHTRECMRDVVVEYVNPIQKAYSQVRLKEKQVIYLK